MSVANIIKEFFSLSALDSRLDPSKSHDKKQQAIRKEAKPSKWGTLEFKFYYVVFIIAVPLMFKAAMDASNETNPNYPRYERLLSKGWILGRKVDNSDQQYRFFRDNLLLLSLLGVIHLTLRKVLTPILSIRKGPISI